MQITKVLSGGQTGADKAGLQAAFDLGIPTGGTAPRGWRICLPNVSDGSNPDIAAVVYNTVTEALKILIAKTNKAKEAE